VSGGGWSAAGSARRVAALVLRNLYLLRSSWPRVAELIYWPAVQLLVWGFLQRFITENASTPALVAGTFVGAVLLWDILFRGQIGLSVTFLEEVWSRNLGNLLVTPLRPFELLLALMTMSLIRLAIGVGPVTVAAFFLFGFNLYGLGLALAVFFVNLILTSFSVGIVVSGLVLRNGLGAESLAWTLMFVMMPLACVYYPVATLPGWLHPLAYALPPTYVFEGMRAALTQGVVRNDLMAAAFALNLAYLSGAVLLFFQLLASAKRHGSLLQAGE
jgi:ABC-2 type transport system permease protein